MLVLQRVREVMLSPRACWPGIAAAGDSPRWLFRRYLPAVVLPSWLIMVIAGLFAGDRDPAARTRETVHFRREADGTLTQVATSEGTVLPAFETALLALPVLVVAVLVAVVVMRWLILWCAPRFGAQPDRDAATRLVVHALTPAFLSLLVPNALSTVALLASLAAFLYVMLLLHHGAPQMLPPAPGRERAFGWSAVLMAPLAMLILLPLAVMVLLLLAVPAAVVTTAVGAAPFGGF